MKPTILILASALGVTACGKKRAECKTLVEEFNASVKALNEAKEEVGSEPKDLISSLDAHIDAAEKLGEALDGMEVTTEELQPIVEEAKTAANAKVEASKRAKASMQSLESLTSDAAGISGSSFKKTFSELQAICTDTSRTEPAPCATLVTLVSSYTKAMSAKDLEDAGKVADKVAALEFKGEAAKKARDAVVEALRAPVDLTKTATETKESTAAARDAFKQAKERLDATAASISGACG